MSLSDLLREAPLSVRARLESSGVPGDLLSALLDDLAGSLRGDDPAAPVTAPHGYSARERAVAISTLGESLSLLALGGSVGATTQEMAALHAWVRARLVACFDELAAEGAVPVTRDVALRRVLATAEIMFIEFDRELRVRWTPDFDRPPFDRASAGRQAEEFLDSSDNGQLTETLRRVLATGVPERAEVAISPRVPLTPHGPGPLEVLVAVEPMRDASGAVVGVICASTDVTELKRTQSALREALGVRDMMIAVLAHDLRNPLTTVRALSSSFARNESLPEKVREGLRQVESASRRMNELIGTLLDFSVARTGGSIPAVRVPTDAYGVVLGMVEELRQTVPDREITLTSGGDTSALIDPPRIAQVVSNLVGNALAHGSPSAPVAVTIDGSGPDLLLGVRNAGPPIPPELIPVLFEPFRRGTTGVGSRAPRGVGLGLFITREIVRAHEGTIEVMSTVDATLFTVRLRRQAASAPSARYDESPAAIHSLRE
jgi:signal transduction histidine kinase